MVAAPWRLCAINSSMNIVSLEPFLTELVCDLGLADRLAAVSHRCDFPANISERPKVTVDRETAVLEARWARFYQVQIGLCQDFVDLEALAAAKPDIILTSVPAVDAETAQAELKSKIRLFEETLLPLLGRPVRILSYNPQRFEQVLSVFSEAAAELGAAAKGRELAHYSRARIMDWCDNFYERMRNKRVTVLSGINPLKLAGRWIPDMVALASGVSQEQISGKPAREIEWKSVVEFRPDVIIVAPERLDLAQSLHAFKILEKIPDWEEPPAVKRGEVFFCDGLHNFYRPGPRLVDSMGILISAMAGLDSGYITTRDSFYRMRWLELQRHRI